MATLPKPLNLSPILVEWEASRYTKLARYLSHYHTVSTKRSVLNQVFWRLSPAVRRYLDKTYPQYQGKVAENLDLIIGSQESYFDPKACGVVKYVGKRFVAVIHAFHNAIQQVEPQRDPFITEKLLTDEQKTLRLFVDLMISEGPHDDILDILKEARAFVNLDPVQADWDFREFSYQDVASNFSACVSRSIDGSLRLDLDQATKLFLQFHGDLEAKWEVQLRWILERVANNLNSSSSTESSQETSTHPENQLEFLEEPDWKCELNFADLIRFEEKRVRQGKAMVSVNTQSSVISEDLYLTKDGGWLSVYMFLPEDEYIAKAADIAKAVAWMQLNEYYIDSGIQGVPDKL